MTLVSGTQLQAREAHANPRVVEHISLIITMSDYRQQFLELSMCFRLSVADAVVLLSTALDSQRQLILFVFVDPWSYHHVDTPASLNHQLYVQSVATQAAHAGKTLIKFTCASR
jgi:hypothetical protein